MEDTKYYIRVKDQNLGPLSYDDVVAKLKSSELSKNDYIFAVGSPGWVQVSSLMQFSAYGTVDTSSAKNERKDWYIHKNKENLGPFSVEKIAEMVRNNEIDADDYTYKKGIAGWTQIKDINEIMSLINKDAAHLEDELSDPGVKRTGGLERLDVTAVQMSPLESQPITSSEPQVQQQILPDVHDDTDYVIKSAGHDRDDEQPVANGEKRNIPELIFGILLIAVALLNLSVSFIASAAVAIIGVVFVAYYIFKNRKGRRLHAG